MMTPIDALELAYNVIMQAMPNQHDPWCNGVHADNGACEGVYLAMSAVDEIEKVLKDHGKLVAA